MSNLKLVDVVSDDENVEDLSTGQPLGAGAFGCVIKKDQKVLKIQLLHDTDRNDMELPAIDVDEFVNTYLISKLKADNPFIVNTFKTTKVPFKKENIVDVKRVLEKNNKCLDTKKLIENCEKVLAEKEREVKNRMKKILPEYVAKKLKEAKEHKILSEEEIQEIKTLSLKKQKERIEQKWNEYLEKPENSKMTERQKDVLRAIRDEGSNDFKAYRDGDQAQFLVSEMEYANSGDLYQKMKTNHIFSRDELRSLFFQMIYSIYGIQRVHKMSHNDIKPENILLDVQQVDRDYNLKLGDKFVPFTVGAGKPMAILADYGLTNTSASRNWTNGTIGWIPPFGVFYKHKSGEKQPYRTLDFDDWTMGIMFWMIAAQGLDVGGNTFGYGSPLSIVRAPNATDNNDLSPHLTDIAKQVMDAYHGGDTNTETMKDLNPAILGATISICFIMESLGHSFFPPDNLTVGKLDYDNKDTFHSLTTATYGPVGTTLVQKKRDLTVALENITGIKDYYGELSRQIKQKIGPELWSVMVKLTAWTTKERVFGNNPDSVSWDHGKFLEDILERIYNSPFTLNQSTVSSQHLSKGSSPVKTQKTQEVKTIQVQGSQNTQKSDPSPISIVDEVVINQDLKKDKSKTESVKVIDRTEILKTPFYQGSLDQKSIVVQDSKKAKTVQLINPDGSITEVKISKTPSSAHASNQVPSRRMTPTTTIVGHKSVTPQVSKQTTDQDIKSAQDVKSVQVPLTPRVPTPMVSRVPTPQVSNRNKLETQHKIETQHVLKKSDQVILPSSQAVIQPSKGLTPQVSIRPSQVSNSPTQHTINVEIAQPITVFKIDSDSFPTPAQSQVAKTHQTQNKTQTPIVKPSPRPTQHTLNISNQSQSEKRHSNYTQTNNSIVVHGSVLQVDSSVSFNPSPPDHQKLYGVVTRYFDFSTK